MHVPENASFHCARKCIIALCPKKCIIALCPKKCIIALCPKKSIIACAQYCMCPKKCIIAYARRNASYDVLDISCAQRNASSHCARDCIVPETCISSRLHCARSFHVPELNQVISIKRCQKQILSLYSLLISQRRHPPKASSFMACGLHVMAWGLILCISCS